MARIDEVRERYENVTERLFSDKKAFEEYIKFAGKFYKLPTAQTMTMYDANPNATMVADYDTWAKFGHQVQRGARSLAVMDGNGVKHYFDISQTKGDKVPYQWKFDKSTAQSFVDTLSKTESRNFRTLSSCVNYLGEASARDNLASAESSLGIEDKDRAAFEKSFISMTQYFIAARCELGSSFKYKNAPIDLAAFDMLANKADKEKLCEFVQIAAKTTLLSMEKTINKIIAERSISNERSQTDLVRGGQQVLSRNDNGERQDVQARPAEVRVSGTGGAGTDRGRSGADERADRPLGQGVAEVYDGELPRRNTVASGSAAMGADTPTDRPRGVGDVGAAAETVRERKSPSENDIHGDRGLGENAELRGGTRGNGTDSASAQDVNDNISGAAAEDITPAAFSYDLEKMCAWAAGQLERAENVKDAFREYQEITAEDEAVYDSFTAYEWFEKEVRTAGIAFFNELGQGRVDAPDFSREEMDAFLNDYQHDSEHRFEVERKIAELIHQSLTRQAEVRAFAEENNIPFREQAAPEADEQDYDPYAYDGSMSLDDAQRAADAHNLSEFMETFSDELEMAAVSYSIDEFKEFYERRAAEELSKQYSVSGSSWAKPLLSREYLHSVCELVAGGAYNQIKESLSASRSDEIPDYNKYYVDRENETVVQIHYNPESSAGGQLVYNYFSFDDIFNASKYAEPMAYLQRVSRQEILDKDSPYFDNALEEFKTDSEDISGRDDDYFSKLNALTEPRFAIFQLRDDENLRDYRFASADELKKRGLYVDVENYSRVYRGRLRAGETLNDIFERFNTNRPSDFYGHSLSMGDVIGILREGEITAHYVDRFGFVDVPDFALSLEERTARRTLTDNIIKVAECNQLASDEMDTLGDYLFRFESVKKSKSDADYTIGNGLRYDRLYDLAEMYHNGENISEELAKGIYHFGGYYGDVYGTGNGNVYYSTYLGDKIDIDFNYNTVQDENGVTFSTKGGFEVRYTWKELGDTLIAAALKEVERHKELDRQYREDLEQNGSLYLALRDRRTIYLNKISGLNNANYTDFRLEYEGESTKLTAANENNERVDIRTFGVGNYHNIIHSLLDESDTPTYINRFEVTGIEREPVFKVEANPDSRGEAFIQAYEKTENDTLIPRDILYFGTFEKCNEYAEDLRLGKVSQEWVKNVYADIVKKEEDTRAAMEKYEDTLSEIRNGGNSASITPLFNSPFEYVITFGAEERYSTKDMSNFKLRYNEENGFHITCDLGETHKDHIFQTFHEDTASIAYYVYKHTDGEIRFDAPQKTESRDNAPYVTVTPFSKVDFAKIGLDANKQYTIPEFNAALNEADRLYTAADEYENRIDTFTVSLHINGKNAQYRVMLGVEYGSLSAIMNANDLVNPSNIGITHAEKELVAEIEGNAVKTVIPESTIHFALLGNGITCYDTARAEGGDYPTVAHISNEGNITYYDESLTDEDISAIEAQAAQQKKQFTEDWNKLPIESRYERLLEAATPEQFSRITHTKQFITMAEAVGLYEHSVIFKDEDFPAAERAPRTPDEIYKSLSDNDRVFFDTNAYADILYIEGLVKNARANKGAEQIRLSDREKQYAERFSITPDEFRALIRYHEAELAKQTITVSPDDLSVGDYVRGNGHIWRITNISDDFSISFENTDKSENLSVQSIYGRWKEQFIEQGFEYISPDEYKALSNAQKSVDEPTHQEKPNTEASSQSDDTPEYTYGEQLQFNLFGEPVGQEAEPVERQIIGGVDTELALKNDLIKNGTGFQDGKFRVDDFYREHRQDMRAFAKFLADEFGTGGHSGEGKVRFSNHDSKGIELEIQLDNGERTNVSWSWSKVANRIAALIDNNEYINQADIDRHIEYSKGIVENYSPETEPYKKAVQELEKYGLLTPEAPAQEEVLRKNASEIKAGDTFKYRGQTATVTDDIGIYPDDIVISVTETTSTGVSYAVTQNVDKYKFAREAEFIPVQEQEHSKAPEQSEEDEILTAEEVAELRDFFTNPERAAERQQNAERMFAAAEAALENEQPTTSEKTDEVKLKTTVIDIANGVVYDTDYQPPEKAEEQPPIEGTPTYKVGDHIEVDFGNTHYSGKLTYVGDIEVTVKPDVGYSWEVQTINREIFDRQLRKDSRNAPLFKAEQERHDFTITDTHLGEGGLKAKFAANLAAIKLLKEIEQADRLATPEEQETLSRYVGWGGLKQAFEPNNKDWADEYKQLKETLTPEEYTAAQSTVLNAHYTSPVVISAIYKGLEKLGFNGGNILEPSMGIGNFFGGMPDDMRQSSRLHGVEIDSITGRIAKQLYQNADIQVAGYENTAFSDNYFDAAVGNVPFGSYGVFDKRYNRENFLIHDYFFAKTLDKVAPNGIIAFVTSKGTLDKQNPKVREYLARRADLVGAIRLPNNAFKANAGTEVTTDIIFLQKREKMAVELPDWCYVGRNNDGVPINNYFLDHPEMVLGEMKQGVEFSMYGNSTETACVPIEGADLSEQLEKAVANLHLTHALQIRTQKAEEQAGIIPATPDVRNFTFAEIGGKMYFRENNNMTLVTETGKKAERIKALNELRTTFREILSAQEHNCSDDELTALQAKLNEQYDRFVKAYGNINDSANAQAFSRDDDYNSLCALEVIDEENKTIEKADFFTKRTVKFVAEITHVDTPQEAMQVSVDTIGKMDIPYMARLCDQEPQAVIDILKADNLIYLNPVKANSDNPFEGWEEASEYLSGNVREKLRTAELFAKDNPEFERNAAALTSVLPPKLEAGDITARIGVSWVDVEDYQKFLEEYAKARFVTPMRRTITGEYKIENKTWDTSAAATEIYGTKRMTAKMIFENLLNSRDIVVRDKITEPDGREHYELNKRETDLAQDKALKMKEAFKRWLWDDPARREKYVERYNNLFNCIVGRKFDGSHQTFPGMSPAIQLKPHQLDAVMRAKFGGNTLLAHCVGAGKSFEMIAATMDKKRLGLINKACVVVPKHLVGQMASEWLRLYPQAKILTASEKDFDKDHRQKFIGRCCTGDYDAVIMSYEQFEKIPMSMEYRRDFIQREIDTLQDGIDELKGDSGSRSSVKDLEREKKRLEVRLQKLIEGSKKTKDTSLTFEQLGFDSLVVDEAHNYKNGLVVSKMNRVSGVQTRPAQKSEDILMKTQYLNENYGEKNILFATGTPVSNSMTELYIMQRYLRPSLLEQAGLQTFDDWAANFGEVVSKAELKPAGNGYHTKKRFAKFNNVPELMQMYKEFADVKTSDMLKLPVPEIEGGKPQTIVATPNDVQKAYMQELAKRSEAIHSGTVDPSKDNMLKVTGEARLLGLDARCIMQGAENYPDSKVNLCIDKVMEIYQATTENKGVQAIFCDIAVNSDDGRFSVYDYIKEELVRRGIPESEICTAGDAETQKQRNEMYAQLRSGTKRIVLASTSKMGTGANIQTKLCALHNLDIPWKPSDIEQRNGRIIRQGNDNPTIGIYNYVTENTFDAYLMNIIVTKQKFISQLMNGSSSARSCEDMDEAVLNYSQMQALASGDDRIKEKIELDADVARLRMLESDHYNAQYRLEDTIITAQRSINSLNVSIEKAQQDKEFAEEHKPQEDEFKVEIGGTVYTERKAAGEALQKLAIKAMASMDSPSHIPIGNYCGFELAIEKIRNGFTVGAGISLRKNLTYTADIDIKGDIGNITRLENLFNKGIDKKLTEFEDRLTRAQTDLQAAQAAKGKPFEHADELAEKSARLEQLNRELEVGQVDEVIMNESEDEEQEQGQEQEHEHDNPDHDAPDKDKPDTDRGKPNPKHKR